MPHKERAGSVVLHTAPSTRRRSFSTGVDIFGLHLGVGAVLIMVPYWTYYIGDVRREPGLESWYGAGDFLGAKSDGVLFIYSYCTFITRAAGVMTLVESVNLPEIVNKVLIFRSLQHLSSEPLDLREWSELRFRGQLFRIGSLTSARQNALDGASAEKPREGQRTNSAGGFLGVKRARCACYVRKLPRPPERTAAAGA